jgi:hypothetical protein
MDLAKHPDFLNKRFEDAIRHDPRWQGKYIVAWPGEFALDGNFTPQELKGLLRLYYEIYGEGEDTVSTE